MRRTSIAVLVAILCAGSVAFAGGDTRLQALQAYNNENYAEAMRLFRQRAESGDAEAQYYLARMYEKGQGVAKDEDRVRKWYRRSAEGGYAKAQYKLAVGYAFGLGGVDSDETEAVKWLKRSAEGGYRRAQRILSRAYAEGRFGLRQDPQLSEYWARKAERRS